MSRPRRPVFRLPYKTPFDWDHLLTFLARRAVEGVEWCDGEGYRRTIRIGRRSGMVRVTNDAKRRALVVDSPWKQHGEEIERRVRALFDLDHDPAKLAAALGRDPILGPILRRRPGIRVPGAWDGFEIGVRAVVGQQVSVAAARGTLGKLAAKLGEKVVGGVLFPDAPRLAAADLRDGMPASRLATLRAIAVEAAAGRLDLRRGASPDETIRTLRAIRGIGEWTAGYIAMRALGAADAFPAGDLVLRKAAGGISSRELETRAEAWRPWRAYASMLLWSC